MEASQAPEPSSLEILRILDAAAEACNFPMLDNGYLYLAATRMSLFRSAGLPGPIDWALVIEVFGFSPRAGLPDLCVTTFGSRLCDRDEPQRYASPQAHQQYLREHPCDDSRFFFPIAEGDWQDPESAEFLAPMARQFSLRDRVLPLPDAKDYARAGIALSELPRICTFELCRAIAHMHRHDVLATPAERRVSVPPDLALLLCLDDWHHPDLAAGVLPSQTKSFQQIAQVLASGDISAYHQPPNAAPDGDLNRSPDTAPNTHWRHWPEGGLL